MDPKILIDTKLILGINCSFDFGYLILHLSLGRVLGYFYDQSTPLDDKCAAASNLWCKDRFAGFFNCQ